MDDKRLKEIRERLAKTTPGPWRQIKDGLLACGLPSDTYTIKGEHVVAGDVYREDAAFIANAPTDIADLLAEVERLKAELEHERLRLAACGVAALGYTDDPGCAGSASFDDVLRLRADNKRLREACLSCESFEELEQEHKRLKEVKP